MSKLARICFAGENKSTVTRHLHDLNANPNPLETLEQWVNHKDYTRREVGFCAQWCLDNLCKYEPKSSVKSNTLTASNFFTSFNL